MLIRYSCTNLARSYTRSRQVYQTTLICGLLVHFYQASGPLLSGCSWHLSCEIDLWLATENKGPLLRFLIRSIESFGNCWGAWIQNNKMGFSNFENGISLLHDENFCCVDNHKTPLLVLGTVHSRPYMAITWPADLPTGAAFDIACV